LQKEQPERSKSTCNDIKRSKSNCCGFTKNWKITIYLTLYLLLREVATIDELTKVTFDCFFHCCNKWHQWTPTSKTLLLRTCKKEKKKCRILLLQFVYLTQFFWYRYKLSYLLFGYAHTILNTFLFIIPFDLRFFTATTTI
jgi:hypothetical protein